jgi:imidazole glycerol-phosphate synthase subunit HisH
VKVAIINYGMGNLGSVRRALDELAVDAVIADYPEAMLDANRLILPGVGAFGEAMARLKEGGWIEPLRAAVRDRGRPLLGICLGMQMLASASEENGVHDGLDFIPGRVRRLDALGCTLRIPHVGWNEVRYVPDAPLFAGLPQSMDFYFVHSYAFVAEDDRDVTATSRYDADVTAAVGRGLVFGTQFHPEKSSRAGRHLLKNFLDVPAC